MKRISNYINTDPLGAGAIVLTLCGVLALVVFGR